jgi:2-polyprenyl-6-methoxyphenol hydroxylase-like FAD-dependent oxidoreductase
MAMEDACVLTEVLRRYATVAEALTAYELRREPRVRWVHQESQAAADSFRLPPAVRNKALRQFGKQMFRRHFEPLLAPP